MAKRFDHKDYFSSAPKLFVIRAEPDMGYPAEAKKLPAGTKAAASKTALTLYPKAGWLPPELRTSHYKRPGAKKAAR